MKNFLKKLNVAADRADDANSSSGEALPIKLLNYVISTWVSNKKTTSEPFPGNDQGSGGDESRISVRPSSDPKFDEEHQLQLELELSSKEDPEAVQIEAVKQISASSSPAEMVTYRYWNYNALSYEDKVVDGFYDLYGVSSESDTGTWEAVIVDTIADANLMKLKDKTKDLAEKFQINSDYELARSIARLVSEFMGGVVKDEQSMRRALRSLSYSLKTTLRSVVLPLGSLTLGLSRHRALLYKVLADSAGIPCRITKGCQYDEAMCFVKIDDGREFIVDLTNDPDNLTPAEDERENSSITNPEGSQQRPLLRSSSWSEGVSSRKVKAKDIIQEAKGSPKVNLPFENRPNENPFARPPVTIPVAAAAAAVVATSIVVAAVKSNPASSVELPVAAATAAAVAVTTAAANSLEYGSEGERFSERSSGNESARSEIGIDDVEEIYWEEIVVGERIGIGSCGEVYKGEWRNTEVAVKRFLDQDITGEGLAEFRSEVTIMQKLRHPNVLLFMGAVTRPPNLSIVTEFLARGSLYRLLHRPNNHLDHRRRIKMALDTARGMNYLHSCCPVIVHRDLKSPNLLVDRNWTVKVSDFGLSRTKHNTFLSSRSTAGTAEWMAPEVLRNEPSNEKCDVYSFGVILWELCTMQRPWWGMNPMQVVGAVGFQDRRLDIPITVDSDVADVISKCWQTDPKLRPSFAEIIASLKPIATSNFTG